MFSEFRQADDLHRHRDPIKIDLELNLHCKEANSNVPAAAPSLRIVYSYA